MRVRDNTAIRDDQPGWISQFFLATGPFNTLYNSSMSTNPIAPAPGIHTVGNVTNTASVTVTNMNQFALDLGA